MKHDACTHPRTPAGRAACRKGSQSSADATKGVTPKVTPAKRVKGSTRVLKGAGQLIHTPDAVDVPRPLSPYIKQALERGWEITAGSPYTETQRVIRIVGDAGVLQLVWNATLPFGVADASFRSHRSSVTRRVETVGEGMRALQASS
jgi:hypothetical protein